MSLRTSGQGREGAEGRRTRALAGSKARGFCRLVSSLEGMSDCLIFEDQTSLLSFQKRGGS